MPSLTMIGWCLPGRSVWLAATKEQNSGTSVQYDTVPARHLNHRESDPHRDDGLGSTDLKQ